MQTAVLFSKIKEEIINCLYKATKEIKVAVAWLIDEDIIRVLTQRKEAGIYVQIVISDSIENFLNNRKFKDYLRLNGQLFVFTKTFLHNKFCIIDDSLIINGSYNWTYNAILNEENIVIMSLDKSIEDLALLNKFNQKYNFFCNKSVKITDLNILNSFRNSSKNMAVVISEFDENEIKLRQEFEDDVRKSFEQARLLKINVSSSVFESMMANGGGVEAVKKLLNDEIATGEMKSGFRKLEEQIPHRVDLSFEYIVSIPKYFSLFNEREVLFCNKKMQKYGL